MKEDILEALMYIFDYCVDQETGVMADADEIEDSLSEVGFSKKEAEKAMAWLDGLADWRKNSEHVAVGAKSVRIFSSSELKLLPKECVNYIIQLSNKGILDPLAREMIIERSIALAKGNEQLDLDKIRWVTMMILFNLPDQEHLFAMLEDNAGELTIH